MPWGPALRQRGWLLLPVALLLSLAGACSSRQERVDQAPARAARVLVRESGMYELRAADLQAALGWDAPDPTQLQLFYEGRQQPLWVEGQAEALVLRFYGQASQSPYARENVYWLRRGAGPALPMQQRDAAPTQAPVSKHYTATQRLEQQLLYMPQVDQGERWLWHSLAAPRTLALSLTLAHLAPGPARLRLALWASTAAPASPDHHLRIALNGQQLADLHWDGQGRQSFMTALPAGLLHAGTNTIQLEAPGDTGVPADISVIDWLELEYPRLLHAQADQLEFNSSAGVQQLSGLSQPAAIFDISEPERPVRLRGLQPAAGAEISVQGQAGRRYLALGAAGFRRPLAILPATAGPDLRAPGQGADYIAIGPPELLEPLAPLLELRHEQGLRTLALPAQLLYDQFSHGRPEPEAIRAFLQHAARHWQPAPRYLLLVGDASYDPRGYQAPPEANRLPTFLVPTGYGGETASDLPFVELDDDGRPDLAVGRLPARTADQLTQLVRKILAYEQRPPAGDWRGRVLAIADGSEALFSQQADAFLQLFGPAYQRQLLTPAAGAATAGEQVRQQLDQGSLLVAYFGHGSIGQWGKQRLLSAADSTRLANGERLPIVINMTCLTGLFSHPRSESLAEALLWQPGGGAIAVLAPTSLTLPTDQSFLSHALARELQQTPATTLGESLLRARRSAPVDDPGQVDVLETFLLFGDPALRPAAPER